MTLCTRCGKPHKRTKSRPIDVCAPCKHKLWVSKKEALGIDLKEMRRVNLESRVRVYEDEDKNKYYLLQQTYDEMLDYFEHRCGCCGLPESQMQVTGPRKLAVDHCHKSGKVRGLLCFKCNQAIGSLGDTVEALERAIEYLEDSEKLPFAALTKDQYVVARRLSSP